MTSPSPHPNARILVNKTCSQLLVWSILFAALSWSARGSVFFTNVLSLSGTNGPDLDGPLLQASDGSFYGTMGGLFSTNNSGSVFNLSPSGILKTVATFYNTNGSDPCGPLVQTADGSIYGTTQLSGPRGWGTVFKISPDGALEGLQAFNGTNGAYPYNLLLGPDGALYGTTHNGGNSGPPANGFGTIFRIDTNGLFSTLVTFNGTNGITPEVLILGKDGIFYGVTHAGGAQYGGSPSASPGNGTVFQMALDGTLTTLFSFNVTNGGGPSGLIEGTDGNLYGVTGYGGSNFNSQPLGAGIAFCLTKGGVLNKLVEFPSTNYWPTFVIQGVDGNFYGGTVEAESIFQLSPSGILTFVHTFPFGTQPIALMRAADNTLYGTTRLGGINNRGTIFRLIILPDPPLLQSVNQANGELNFTWNAYPGRSYQVQSAADLVQSAWVNLGSSILATNSILSFSDAASSAGNRFYRVALLP